MGATDKVPGNSLTLANLSLTSFFRISVEMMCLGSSLLIQGNLKFVVDGDTTLIEDGKLVSIIAELLPVGKSVLPIL